MAFGFKKKKEVQPAPKVEQKPDNTMTNPGEIKKEVIKIEDVRNVLDEISEKLDYMQSPAFSTIAVMAARKNQEIIEQNDIEFSRRRKQAAEEGNTSEVTFIDNRQKLEDDLYIVESEIEPYFKTVAWFAGKFKTFPTADTRSKGADKIDSIVLNDLNHLENALKSAQKKKTEICLGLLRYAAMVAHGELIGNTEEERQRCLNRRLETIEQFHRVIDATDSIYGTVHNLNIEEKRAAKILEEVEPDMMILSNLPKETIREIDKLGFAGVANKENDPGSEIVKYARIGAQCHALYVLHAESQDLIDNYENAINRLKAQIDVIVNDIDKRYEEQGQNFNEAAFNSAVEQVHSGVIDEIDSMKNSEKTYIDSIKDLESKLEAVRNNPNLSAAQSNALHRALETAARREDAKLKSKERNKQINTSISAMVEKVPDNVITNDSESEQRTEILAD